MRLVRLACDAMTIVLVCIGFFLTASTGHAHILPDVYVDCSACPAPQTNCISTQTSCWHVTHYIPCNCCGCVGTVSAGCTWTSAFSKAGGPDCSIYETCWTHSGPRPLVSAETRQVPRSA